MLPRRIGRREMLRLGAASGVALVAGGSAALRGEPAGSPPAASFELDEATVAELAAAMESGQRTARSIAQAYLERIAAVDPRLHAVIEVNPEAPAIAEQLDAERRQRGPRGPLHGIPVLIKDNIATGDRMETTAGSLALVGGKAPRDAFLVERLRRAGAVLLGKTNLSEWANFRSTHSSSGWSARGGQCGNPYALDRNPCGSSSGSGAAAAANLATLTVGTETDGSIVCPSHTCSVVGLKPTVGLVSRSGIVPISHTQDTAGPMTRTVTDAALLLTVLAGEDPRDAATHGAAGHIAADYTKFLDPRGLAGTRLGVARAHFFGYSKETDRVVEAALEALKAGGAELIDPADIPHVGDYDAAEFDVLLYEFKTDLEAYLGEWAPGAPARTLADLIRWNEAHREQELRYFGQEIFEMAVKKGPLTDKPYRQALARCRKLAREQGLDAVFSRHRLDAIVAPTGAPAWPTDLVNGDHFLGASSTPAAVAGYPTISVPAGYAFGLPVGLTFIGPAWGEGKLLKLAYAYEQATRARRPPRLPATADFNTV